MKQHVIIIGGGASGLCAGINLARLHYKVTIIEQNNQVGKKILASGNGKCNISNTRISEKYFHSTNKTFIRHFLKGYDYQNIKQFFNSIGLMLTENHDHKVYPMSLQARSVVELLSNAIQQLGINVYTNTKVEHISKKNKIFYIKSKDISLKSDKLIIASGSLAAKHLGGTESSYQFASFFNHPLIQRYPALVQLCSNEPWIKYIVGIKLKADIELYANDIFITQKSGDILFTKYGISGLSILDISRYVSIHLAQNEYCKIKIDLIPMYNKKQLINMMLDMSKNSIDKPVDVFLSGFIHIKLTKVILQLSKVKSQTQKQITHKDILKIVHTIKNFTLTINDTRGFEYAEISTGGIDTRYINPKTLESTIVKNLFFIGEALDVDGERGGYNLFFAWLCGIKVAL